MDIGERVGHTLILGTTRVGKTRLAEILIAQDIRRGDVVIVFDPKGYADNGNTQQDATQDIEQRYQEATENKPQDVEQK